jgi:hypothetical protein
MGSSSAVRRPEETVVRIAVEDLGEYGATLEAELGRGRAIALTRGDAVIAEVQSVQPAKEMEARSAEMPDFMARLRQRWGDTPRDFDSTAWISEEREERF